MIPLSVMIAVKRFAGNANRWAEGEQMDYYKDTPPLDFIGDVYDIIFTLLLDLTKRDVWAYNERVIKYSTKVRPCGKR